MNTDELSSEAPIIKVAVTRLGDGKHFDSLTEAMEDSAKISHLNKGSSLMTVNEKLDRDFPSNCQICTTELFRATNSGLICTNPKCKHDNLGTEAFIIGKIRRGTTNDR